MSEELPEGWAEVDLRELLREPLRNGHSAKASDSNNGVRTLTLTAVTYNDFSERNTKLTVADRAKVTDLWLEEGDILIERSNTPELVGTAAMYRGPSRWAIFPDLLIRVRPSAAVVPAYLEAFLRSPGARKHFTDAAQGTAGSMPKIDQGTIEGLQVPLAPLEEQRRIVEKLESIFAHLQHLRSRLRRAAQLEGVEVTEGAIDPIRQAIFKRAFAGDLVPTEAQLSQQERRGYDSAAALIERVKATSARQPSRSKPPARRRRA